MSSEAAADFDTFVQSRYGALLRSAYLFTGEWARAEDLVQTALSKTWFHWGSVRDRGAAEAYVRTVMTNTYRSWWRRKWSGEVPTADVPESATGDAYTGVDDRDRLLRALATLSRRTRAMIVLRYFEDLPETEIAETMGCAVGTVKGTLSRGLARLRDKHVLDETGSASASEPGRREEAQ